jgi:hypothetical protein
MEWRIAGLAVAAGLMMAASSLGAGIHLESSGLRGGFSAKGSKLSFYQTEAFVDWNLPWRCESDSGFRLQTKLDASAGWMNGRGDHAFVGTLGPMVSLGWKGFPLRLDLGSSPTILSRDEFGHTDVGIPFQFTTQAQLMLELGRHVAVGYRYQHMSNANISRSNPGVNMQMISIGYRF